eukprot:6187875-Pleurochrysis_carterae.AAC.1
MSPSAPHLLQDHICFKIMSTCSCVLDNIYTPLAQELFTSPYLDSVIHTTYVLDVQVFWPYMGASRY